MLLICVKTRMMILTVTQIGAKRATGIYFNIFLMHVFIMLAKLFLLLNGAKLSANVVQFVYKDKDTDLAILFRS